MNEETLSELEQLAAVIENHTAKLLECWRSKLKQVSAARGLSRPALTDHLPEFIKELTRSLLNMPATVKAGEVDLSSAPEHGLQRLQVGFKIEDIVVEYNILRECIHDLADEHRIFVSGVPLRVLNRLIDGAIALAVRSYAIERSREIDRRREEHLSFVAHDLRTPLNAITIAAELLEKCEAGKGKPAAEKALRALHRNVQQLTVLTENILCENSGRPYGSEIQPECRDVDLWPLVESILHGLRLVADTGNIVLVNEVPDGLAAYADALLLRRVFQNLLANAITHAPRGEVRISAKAAGSDGTVECEVADTGCGIQADRLPRIFEKYETGRINGEGIGLGLAICKAFVEAHGGRIEVHSLPGQGSIFRFSLPGKMEVRMSA